jgi:hypothetical protein
MSKRDTVVRDALLAEMQNCRALVRAGFSPTYWTVRYIELADLHNRLYASRKQRVSLVP